MIIFDIRYIFHAAGGPSGLLAMLREDYPDNKIGYATVQMWHHRLSISSAWVAAVLRCLTKRGHKLEALMMDDDPFAGPVRVDHTTNISCLSMAEF